MFHACVPDDTVTLLDDSNEDSDKGSVAAESENRIFPLHSVASASTSGTLMSLLLRADATTDSHYLVCFGPPHAVWVDQRSFKRLKPHTFIDGDVVYAFLRLVMDHNPSTHAVSPLTYEYFLKPGATDGGTRRE